MDSTQALDWAVTTILDPKRIQAIRRLYNYYEGVQELNFATQKFKAAFGQLFHAFAYNRCEAVVTTFTDRLFVEAFDCGENTELAKQAEEIWGLNRMDAIQSEVHDAVIITGNAYVIVWPSADSEAVDGKPFPQMLAQRPEQCAVSYFEEVPTDVEVGAKAWKQLDNRYRCTLYFQDRIERYVTTKAFKDGDIAPKPNAFEPFTDDDGGPRIPNPYGIVPMIAFRNHPLTGDPEGRSELINVIPLQNAINKTLADELVAGEFGAFPQKVIIGVEDEAEGFVAEAIGVPQANSTSEAMRRFESGVDRILTLMDPASKIAEFSATQLDQFEKVAEGWDIRISRATKIPVHYLTMSGGFPSGRALRTADTSLAGAVTKMQRNFGNSWEDCSRLALTIAGASDIGKISSKWASAAPMPKEDEMDLVQQMVNVGIPLEVALAEIGMTPEEIEEITKLRDEQMVREAQIFAMGNQTGEEGDISEREQERRETRGRRQAEGGRS